MGIDKSSQPDVTKLSLTSCQRDIWLECQILKGEPVYNITQSIGILGKLHIGAMRKAVNLLIRQQAGLRLCFFEEAGVPYEKVKEYEEYEVPYIDFSTSAAPKDQYEKWKAQEFSEMFDVTERSYNFYIIKVGELHHVLLFKVHHLISDGYGCNLIRKKIINNYNQIQNKELYFEEEDRTYVDYILSDEKWRTSQSYMDDIIFWKDKYHILPERMFRFREKQNNMLRDSGIMQSESKMLVISGEDYQRLTGFCKKERVFPVHIFAGVLAILLCKMGNLDKIALGFIVHNRRNQKELETIGHFANEIPIQIYLNEQETFHQLLGAIKQEIKECSRHSRLAKGEIERAILDKSKENLSFLEVSINYIKSVTRNQIVDGETAFDFHMNPNQRKPLAVNLWDKADDCKLEIQFNYQPQAVWFLDMDRFLSNLQQLHMMLYEYGDRNIEEYELVSPEEKHKLLYKLNQTAANYPEEKTVLSIFEEKALVHAKRTAVVCRNQEITYEELNKRADLLAEMIVAKGIVPGDIIAVLVMRSIDMIIGILGVLKAGCVYLPIDPDYPMQRIIYMLQDSEAKLLLTSRESERIGNYQGDCLFIDDAMYDETKDDETKDDETKDDETKDDETKDDETKSVEIKDDETENNDTKSDEIKGNSNTYRLQPDSDLYIIYTSGTTGNPKGTVITHRNVVRLLYNDKTPFQFSHEDVWTLFHSFCFDFSVWEMYGALLYGGKLIIVDKWAARDSGEFRNIVIKERVTVLNQTPTAFRNLMLKEKEFPVTELNTLRYIIFGGEALRPILLKDFHKKYPKIKLINMYGITETTVHTTFLELSGQDMEDNRCNIGTPIPTVTAYVFDKYRRLLPMGSIGELYIGGAGVAQGYVNRPDLTAERFIENPYVPQEKIYKSGDLVRILQNGTMEYIGRNDHQVKIRGFRIETGEIENCLIRSAWVEDAYVTVRRDASDNKFICAYVVGKDAIPIVELREYLQETLPAYMIPSHIIQLDKMPLTSSSKIDTANLPGPEEIQIPERIYEKPENEIEICIAKACQEVLKIQQIGSNDNFFHLGGDSISALQICARIKEYGYLVSMKDIFAHPVLSELAKYAVKGKEDISQETVTGRILLTPIQQWFFKQNFHHENYYHQEVLLKSREGFNEHLLEQVLKEIVIHHDALRIVFQSDPEGIHQVNRGISEENFGLQMIPITQEGEIEQHLSQIRESINIQTGPLLQSILFRMPQYDIVSITIHHLVIDAVSFRIILEDFSSAYEQLKNGQKITLPQKTDSYQIWAEKLQEYGNSGEIQKQYGYWESIVRKLQGNFHQTFGQSIASLRGSCPDRIADGDMVAVSLTRETTGLLLTRVNQSFHTEVTDILLSALGMAIKEWRGIEQVALSMEGHGREEIIPELNITRTVGWFTTMYPIILDMDQSEDLMQVIVAVKENIRRIPDKGIGFGILSCYHAGWQNSGLSYEIPGISFNYLGQFDVARNGGFEIAEFMSAARTSRKNQRPFFIDINGFIVHGELVIQINYNKNIYSRNEVTTFSQKYHDFLNKIIQYCLQMDKSVLTPSDVSEEELSMNELDIIMGVVNGL